MGLFAGYTIIIIQPKKAQPGKNFNSRAMLEGIQTTQLEGYARWYSNMVARVNPSRVFDICIR